MPVPIPVRSPSTLLRRSFRLVRRLVLPMAVVCLSGCNPLVPELSVPVSNWPGYEIFPLAKARDLDRQQGLKLKLPAYSNPQDIVHAYLRGDLQIAQLTTVEAVDLCVRVPKRCPVVVLVLNESLGGDRILGQRTLRSIADLRGQPVAITPTTLGPYVLSRALQRQGLSLANVELRPMAMETMPRALATGEVAAAAMYPPFSDQAQSLAPMRVLFTSREIPGEIFDVLVVDPSLLSRDRLALVKLLRSWQAALAELQRHPQAAIALMAKREGVSPAEFRVALEGLVFRNLERQQPLFRSGGLLERNLRDLRRVQGQLGLMPATAPLPPVDGSLMAEALGAPR